MRDSHPARTYTKDDAPDLVDGEATRVHRPPIPRPRTDEATTSASHKARAAIKRATAAKEAEVQTKNYAKRAGKHQNGAEKADRLLKDVQSKARMNTGR